MILLLSSEQAADGQAGANDGARISRRTPRSLDEVLGWIDGDEFERVVIHWPTPGFNPFALARRLKTAGGPQVILAGQMRPETRFWAERNGCLLATDPADALADRGGPG